MLNELQQVEWKLGRGFDVIEVASLDNYFGSDLERILSWLTDRMKLVCESVRLLTVQRKRGVNRLPLGRLCIILTPPLTCYYSRPS